MSEDGKTGSNEQKAVAKGRGSLAINAAQYANVTVYQYVTYAGDKVTVQETIDPSRCPYPGLETFRTSEAKYFAGREDDVAELQVKLRDHDICGVIAASGAGKSSLVHAGLIPALAERETEAWDVFAFKPGQEPLYGLARSMSGVLAKGDNVDAQLDEINRNVEALRREPGRLRRYIEEIISRRADAIDGKHHHVLIFVDQWEELYTQEKDEDREILVRELMDVAERGLVKVLLTMRIDFMEEMLLLSTDFFRDLKPGIHFVEPMDEAGLRSAIEVPAGEVGLGVPEALTSRLIADLGKGRDHGSLPYLQFVLRQLWEMRDQATNSLTTEAYDGIKGLKGAIGAHADAVFRKLTKEEQGAAQRVLPRLANVSEAGAITSRRLPFADFDEPARKLLRKLAEPERRLVVLSSATEEVAEAEIVAEVAHEALLDDWKTLSGWIADRKHFFRLRNKLENDAKTWIENNGRNDFLIPAGKPLLDAQDLSAKALEGDISKDLKDFVKASDLRARSRKRWTGGLVTAALVAAAAVTTIFGFQNRNLEASNAALDRSLLLSRSDVAVGNGNLPEAVRLIDEARQLSDSHQARSRLQQIAFDWVAPELQIVLARNGYFQSLAYTPSGHLTALGTDGFGIRIGPDSGESIVAPAFNGSSSPWAHAVNDAGDMAVVSFHGTLVSNLSGNFSSDVPFVMGRELSREDATVRITENAYVAVVNAGDGVDRGGPSQYVARCPLTSPSVCETAAIPFEIDAVALSEDGRFVLIVTDSERAVPFDWDGGQVYIQTPLDPADDIQVIDWVGDVIAMGTASGNVILHRIDNGEIGSGRIFASTGDTVTALRIHPSGDSVLYTCSETEICLRRLDGTETMMRHPFSSVGQIAFSPDGTQFSAQHVLGGVSVWATPTTGLIHSGLGPTRATGYGSPSLAVAASAAGDVATVRADRSSVVYSADGALSVFDIPEPLDEEDRRPLGPSTVHLETTQDGDFFLLTNEGILSSDLASGVFESAPMLRSARDIAVITANEFVASDHGSVELIRGGIVSSFWQLGEAWFNYGTPSAGGVAYDLDTGRIFMSHLDEEILEGEPGSPELFGRSIFEEWSTVELESGDAQEDSLTSNDLREPRMRSVVPPVENGGGNIEASASLSLHPSGNWITSAAKGNRLTVHDIDGGVAVAELALDNEGVVKVLFSPDGGHLAALGEDGRLYVWIVDPQNNVAERDFVLQTANSEVPGRQAIDFDWLDENRLVFSNGAGDVYSLPLTQAALDTTLSLVGR